MSIANAITAGIIYALTEMLALSGSGHLAVVNKLFDLHLTQMHLMLKAICEFAAMTAIILAYRKDLAAMIRDTAMLTGFSRKPASKDDRFPEARLLFMLAMATIPLLFMVPFRKMYFSLWTSTTFVGAMFLLNGAVLFVAERMIPGKKGLGRMQITDALLIGICQAVYAIRFGMLLAIPALFGSAVLSLADAAVAGIDTAFLAAYFAGGAAALGTGFFSVYLFRRLVRRRGYRGLAYYSLVIGVLSIILTLIF